LIGWLVERIGIITVVQLEIWLFVDKPRFDRDHTSLVYGWAGTRHNMSCHVHAQPVPTIKWIRYNRILENNETFIIYNSGRHSDLQVS